MRSRTLLERLSRPQREAIRASGDPLAEHAESILRNLRIVLGTRRGETQIPGFGIPDLTFFLREFPAGSGALEQQVRRLVVEFEPRLRDVSVRLTGRDDDQMQLSLEIKARLVTDDDEATLVFRSTVDHHGEVIVNP